MRSFFTLPIVALLAVITFSSFSTCKDADTAMKFPRNDFNVLKSYTMPFAGGREGVQGTYYKVELQQTSEGKVEFDSLYIKNQWHRALVEDENPWVVMASTHERAGESATNKDERAVNINIKRPNDSGSEAAYHNKNILSYRINGERRYVDVGNFSPMPETQKTP
ncbi:MAG: hypothetical protein Q4F57_03430 [Weeksellaceae bacterium]|nr:hypothetical protein [Weeksellaceae bacterium]